MKLLSVNVGLTKRVAWRDRLVPTAIFKTSVEGPQRVYSRGILGDQQADLTVHGGPEKAVYVYPSEHYNYWRIQLPETRFDWGSFGENFTTEGILDDEVHVGDQLAIGSAVFAITKPRLPCPKLSLRFDILEMPRMFAQSGLSGFYLSVVKTGTLQAGDAIKLTPGDRRDSSIAGLFRAKVRKEMSK